MLPTESVTAGKLAPGDQIIRDGMPVTVAAVDDAVPRRVTLHLEGGGRIETGKRTSVDRVVKAAPPAQPATPSVVTVSIDEVRVGEFVRWHMLPHRVIKVDRGGAGPDGMIPTYRLELLPWVRGVDTLELTADLPAASRFVRLPEYSVDSPKLDGGAAVAAARPTATTVGRTEYVPAGPDEPQPVADAVIAEPAPTEAASIAEADRTTYDDVIDDAALEPLPQLLPAGPLFSPAEVAAADAAQGVVRVTPEPPTEQVIPLPATPDAAAAMRAALEAAKPRTYTLVVEVFRPTVTAGIYRSSNDNYPDPDLALTAPIAPLDPNDALVAHRDTLTAVDLALDEHPGWAAAGPWAADTDSDFLIVFTRPAVKVDRP